MNDYEDTIVKAIGIGGDSDTVAAMAGGIAYAYWKKIPKHIIEHCLNTLSSEMKRLVEDFSEKYIFLYDFDVREDIATYTKNIAIKKGWKIYSF